MLRSITVDPDVRDHIGKLVMKLKDCCAPEHYQQIYWKMRLEMESGMKRKLFFARQLLELEMKEAV